MGAGEGSRVVHISSLVINTIHLRVGYIFFELEKKRKYDPNIVGVENAVVSRSL